MTQFGGKSAKKSSSDSKRHFTVVIEGKEHGLYISSTPSSAARKAVTKLCTANKSKKVEFSIREITQGSKKKTYGPYSGYIEKLKEPIELKGRVIKYKPVAKLSGKKSIMKGGLYGLTPIDFTVDFTKKGNNGGDPTYKYDSSFFGKDKLFFGEIFSHTENDGKTQVTRNYFPLVLFSDSTTCKLEVNSDGKLEIDQYNFNTLDQEPSLPKPNDKFGAKINNYLTELDKKKRRTAYLHLKQSNSMYT
jgi:hypothetical protein